MLTEEQIHSIGVAYANKIAEPRTISHTLRAISFANGAIWANEQNREEIEELQAQVAVLVDALSRATDFNAYEEKLAAWDILKKYWK